MNCAVDTSHNEKETRLSLAKKAIAEMMEAMLEFNKTHSAEQQDRFSLALFDDIGEKLFDLRRVDRV